MAVGYELQVEFPDQSESFALGFEAGQLYASMTGARLRHTINATIHDTNVELISQLATRCGYTASFNSCGDGWVEAHLQQK